MPDGVIHLEGDFAAPVGRVFRAWTEPADLARWAWGSLGNDSRATVDLRVGGSLRVTTEGRDGTTWAFSGTYLEIEPERRLCHSLRWEAPVGYPPADERVEVEFAPCDGGTRVTFLHAGVPGTEAREGHAQGWLNTFDTLSKLLDAETSGPSMEKGTVPFSRP